VGIGVRFIGPGFLFSSPYKLRQLDLRLLHAGYRIVRQQIDGRMTLCERADCLHGIRSRLSAWRGIDLSSRVRHPELSTTATRADVCTGATTQATIAHVVIRARTRVICCVVSASAVLHDGSGNRCVR
jgi:hypothetical protein